MDPKAITTRSSAGSRGAIAAFLAAVSLALVGLLVTNNPIIDRKSTRLNSSHIQKSRMPSSA